MRVLIFCIAVLSAAVAQAQTFENLNVKGMPTVYVVDRTGTETQGKLTNLTQSALTIALKDGTTKSYASSDVSLVERRGDSLKNGAITGLIVGAILSSIAAADCPHCRVGPFLVYGVGAYTAIGTAIDAAFIGRTRIWPPKR